MRVNDNASSLRRVVLVTAAVAALVFASSLLYNLSVANDWDCEETAGFYSGTPGLASTLDSEQNLHLLFQGRTEEGVQGLVYALSVGDDFEVELVKEGLDYDSCNYETLSIAVDSKGIVYAAAVYRNEDFMRLGLYAVRENGQWQTEIVAPPTWPTDMETLLMGVVVDSHDRANLFYYQASSHPQYYDPVFVWSTISDGVWSNKTVPTESKGYSWLYSACSDASGRVHFTSYMADRSTNETGAAYTVYDGEHLNSTILPRLRGAAPLAIDSYGRPFIGLIENTTGETRYSIASLQDDGWVLNPIAECLITTWGVDIPYIVIDDTDGIHAVISKELSSGHTGVVYASSADGTWSTQEVDKVKGDDGSSFGASVAIGSDGVVRIFYSDAAEDALMMASSEKDTETLMQPYVDAGEVTLIAIVALAAVWLMAVLITGRIRENRRSAEDFKKPFDSTDHSLEEAPEERP